MNIICEHGVSTLRGAPVCVRCEVEKSGLRDLLPRLNETQRLELFEALEEGYCRACGEERKTLCFCENDE